MTDDNALKIAHGCTTADGSRIPVVAQSVVFPSSSPTIATSDGSLVTDLSQVIEQGTFAGLARAIQNRSVFRSQQVKTDTLGNSIGFSATQGALNIDTPGRIPFQFTAPKFVATSCAKRVLVQVAIADVCIFGFGVTDSVKEGKVNLWIPDNGSQYAVLGESPEHRRHRRSGDAHDQPQRLPLIRLPASCGAGIDVTVTPSAADITANLPIPGVMAVRRFRLHFAMNRMGLVARLRHSLLLVVAAAGAAIAHTQDGSLGEPPESTDYYQVTCSDDGSGPPVSLVAQVQNRGPNAASTVSVIVHRALAATATSDSTGGDITASPLVYVNGGDGVYNVFVSKAGSGPVNYTLTYHCMTAVNGGGLHTGTIIVFRQNQ